MRRVVIPGFILVLLFSSGLAGCGFFTGKAPGPGEAGRDQPVGEEKALRIPTGEVDRALEDALAQGGRYIVIADEVEELEMVIADSRYIRVIWDKRDLRVSLPGRVPMATYLADLQTKIAAADAEIMELDQGGTEAAQVVTLTVGITPAVDGGPVSLVTHTLTLLQARRDDEKGKGRLALIIDDFGAGTPGTGEMMELELPLTFAVLPFRGSSAEEAREAGEKGFGVLLHMPMEPLNEQLSPGPGAIKAEMSPAQIRDALAAALEEVPGAVGVNNHMGSRVTAMEEIMVPFLQGVGERGLFFVDSTTTNRSVGGTLARELGVPVAVNRLFLDNEREVEAIKKQLGRAVEIAREQGEAVAIGHVHPAMVQALGEFGAELEGKNVELVLVSHLVR